jgi:signal transduction histidine kinase/ligand-binding sensor domain-containing protein
MSDTGAGSSVASANALAAKATAANDAKMGVNTPRHNSTATGASSHTGVTRWTSGAGSAREMATAIRNSTSATPGPAVGNIEKSRCTTVSLSGGGSRGVTTSRDQRLPLSGDSGVETIAQSERLTSTMTRRVVLGAALVLLAVAASAQPRDVGLAELYHQAWGLREGAPGAVTSIAQTTDGYLWLATPSGLHRFDGNRFERLVPVEGPPLRRVVKVWAFDDGSLWALHDRGALTVFVDGTRTTFTAADGLPPHNGLELVRDAAGIMWLSNRDGLASLAGGRWHAFDAALDAPPPGAFGHGMLVDRSGAHWVSGREHLAVRRPGESRFVRLATSGGASRLVEAPDGRLWATGSTAETSGPVRVVIASGAAARAESPVVEGRDLLFDSRGALWVIHSRLGVARVHVVDGRLAGPVERFTMRDGLTRNEVFAILRDREGNIWTGTSGGLDLFRETALTRAALPPMHAARFAVAPDGTAWVGAMTHPLVRVAHGVVERTNVPTRVTGVGVDPAGTVWAWASFALWRRTSSGFERVAGPPVEHDEASSLVTDRQGRLWAVFLNSGIRILTDGRWVMPDVPGLPDDQGRVRIAIADRTSRVWMGYDTGLVVRYDGARVQAVGLPPGAEYGPLTGLAESGDRIWLARRGGLAAVDGDRVHLIAGIDEGTVGFVRGLARQADGTLWLDTDRGIVRIAGDELERAVANPTVVPRIRIFDYLDGVVGGAAPRPAQSAIATPDGQLWFGSFDGVLALDPARLSAASHPPVVRVTRIRTADRDYAASDALTLPVGTTTVHVAYTGLSLTMPDRVRFRYHLDGVDAGWQEAETRREATYANLTPGTYTFHVIASNNNGVWAETGASTRFVVPPALHQTLAFRSAAVLTLAGLAWAAFRIRVRQTAAAMHGRLEAQVAERERIARELHDTLLQGVQGLILRFHAVASRMPMDAGVARDMEDALSRADDVMREGRQRVRDLRRSAEATTDLADAIARAGDEVVGDGEPIFTVAVEGASRPLHPIVRDEAYWIVREALINARRHGQARRLEAELTYGEDALCVRCRDDGLGMPPTVATAGRPEHFGLRGMRERASRIGGHLHIWSRTGAGTEVELRVPAATAYADAAPPRWAWLQRAWSGDSR